MAYTVPATSFREKRPQTGFEIQSQPKFHINPSSASSSSSSSTSTLAYPNNNNHLYFYQVFLNHRGVDVKKTFASHLYHRLDSYGFRVFFDKKEMQGGDSLTSQIEGAIRSASVHVAIFSPGYADSSWCLNELLQMLGSGNTIIPVFYNVKPDELRWTQGKDGVYALALQNLENKKTVDPQTGKQKPRYDSSTIQNWRNALSLVAELSGFDLQEACNGDEGELLDRVVQCVLEKLKRTRFNVAEYPTGLDEKFKDFENTSKLLKGLTQIEREIESVAQGIQILQEHLSSSHALVVLDDVDNVNQLDALLRPLRTVLSTDSLILITSRDKDVLTSSRVNESSIYMITGLSKQYSRQLFCMHAFSQSHPLLGFENLVEEFLEACDGLPLTLKVFGALLWGRNEKSYWQDQLYGHHQIRESEIKRKLKMSYDSLNKEEQEIFLDIACFFTGENKDTCIRIWDGSGWNGLRGFQNLQNKCLVEVRSDNEIHMHHHLMELGRGIAKASGSRLRLPCETNNIDELLQPLSAITDPRGIVMRPYKVYDDHTDFVHSFLRSDMPWYRRMIHELLGKYMMKTCKAGNSSLQLLDIEGIHLGRILKRFQSPFLIWLRWLKCPYSSLPPWIPMCNLKVLHVFGRELKTLWQDELQAPFNLRELEIWGSLSKFPKSMGKLKHLERIVVNWVPESKDIGNLIKLPEEFCDLRSLKLLELTWSNLKSLPESFGNLTNLEHINFYGSKNLERLPNSFSQLIRLKYLDLGYCNNLTISSESFGNISSIEYINLLNCEKIEELPLQVTRQLSLEQLILKGTRLRALPSEVGALNNLEVLKLSSPLLKALPDSLGRLRKLKKLSLCDCEQLKYLPQSAGRLSQLTKLTVEDCPVLEWLPISMMSQLTKLKVIGCSNLKSIEGLSMMSQLTKLRVIGCSNLKSVEGLWGLVKLQTLNVRSCEKMEKLPSFDTLVVLEELQASQCVKLKRIQGLAQLPRLRTVDVSKCFNLEALEGVEHLKFLVRLDVSGCPKLLRALNRDGGLMEPLRQRLKKELVM